MNHATRTNVAVLGAIFGLSGMLHGWFELLQGNLPTNSLFINAIGPTQQMWPHGTEPAFTLIPNFLLSGIAAMVVGLILIVWSLFYVHKPYGSTVLLLLFILLLLVGGGVAQIIFFPWIWLVATRIDKPLTWWRKMLPDGLVQPLARLWILCLIFGAVLLVFALEIAITGFVPGVSDPEAVLSVMTACLFLVLLMLPLIFITGFAHDIRSASPAQLRQPPAHQKVPDHPD